jgi:hypothetical protein
MRAAVAALLVWLTAAAPGAADQPFTPPGPEESCRGVITAPPDLGVCFGTAAAGGEVGWLAGIACALRKVEAFQLQQLGCLETGIKRIESLRK